jgi:hypothetical protein
MRPRSLCVPVFHIDTNLINARQKLVEVNQLEKWFEDEVILINISSTAYGEAKAGSNALRLRKANQNIFTMGMPADETDHRYQEVQAVLFPHGAQNENQRNDVRVICEAAKYSATLITADGASKTQPGGILGNRDKLQNIVKIMSPREAVDFVNKKIVERDQYNFDFVQRYGGALPIWVGADSW